ncbi:MAG: hypothetical protein DRG78_10110 [Epsilonproteobacteria bacterium]|nr:MAG: hypothetical protein DRG78_10110 [Campylobacterota bacterium]
MITKKIKDKLILEDNEITIDMMDDSAQELVFIKEKIIKKEILKWLILVILALLAPIVMLIIDIEVDMIASWFQRSGSIMVVLALLSDISATTIDRLIIARDHSFLYCNMYIEQEYKYTLNFIKYLSYFIVTIGTLIWGYGDLLYSKLIGS